MCISLLLLHCGVRNEHSDKDHLRAAQCATAELLPAHEPLRLALALAGQEQERSRLATLRGSSRLAAASSARGLKTVRLLCSVSLQQSSIWTSAIGVEKFQNANSAIEEMIYAPGQGGAGRKAKQQVGAAGGAPAAETTRLFTLAQTHSDG